MIKTRDDLQDCLDKDKRALGVKKSRPSIIGDEVWKFEIALRMDTERVRIEESGTKTDVTRLISARMATEFERGLYYGKNE